MSVFRYLPVAALVLFAGMSPVSADHPAEDSYIDSAISSCYYELYVNKGKKLDGWDDSDTDNMNGCLEKYGVEADIESVEDDHGPHETEEVDTGGHYDEIFSLTEEGKENVMLQQSMPTDGGYEGQETTGAEEGKSIRQIYVRPDDESPNKPIRLFKNIR